MLLFRLCIDCGVFFGKSDVKCWVCLKNGEKVEGFSGGKGGFWGALILDFVGFDEMKE